MKADNAMRQCQCDIRYGLFDILYSLKWYDGAYNRPVCSLDFRFSSRSSNCFSILNFIFIDQFVQKETTTTNRSVLLNANNSNEIKSMGFAQRAIFKSRYLFPLV